MTWYYEADTVNNRINLWFEDDIGTSHGPREVQWPDAPTIKTSSDGWPNKPNVQQEAGKACTDLYASVGVETALMALRDLAAGNVQEGQP